MANLITPEGRLSYPALFKPKLNKLSNKEEYGTTLMFKKGEDLSAMIAAVKAAIVEKWGPDQSKYPRDPKTGEISIRNPLRDQSEKAKFVDGKRIMPPGHEEGAYFINIKSKNRPAVVGPDVKPIFDESAVYAGCFAKASVSVFAYSQAGNHGVSFGLNNVQKTRDGDPLGGRSTPEMDFAPIDTGNVAGEAPKTANGLFD